MFLLDMRSCQVHQSCHFGGTSFFSPPPASCTPDAYLLVLVGQVLPVAVVVVVGLEGAQGGLVEELSATLGGKVLVVAGVLGRLQGGKRT